MKVGLTCIAKGCKYISCIDCVTVSCKTLWFKPAVQSKTGVTSSEKNEVSDQIVLEY